MITAIKTGRPRRIDVAQTNRIRAFAFYIIRHHQSLAILRGFDQQGSQLGVVSRRHPPGATQSHLGALQRVVENRFLSAKRPATTKWLCSWTLVGRRDRNFLNPMTRVYRPAVVIGALLGIANQAPEPVAAADLFAASSGQDSAAQPQHRSFIRLPTPPARSSAAGLSSASAGALM